jgi:hypothetical protein
LMQGLLSKKINDKVNVSLGYKWMKRNQVSDIDYLYYPSMWENAKGNGSINVGLNYNNARNRWNHQLSLKLRSSAFQMAQNYSYASATFVHNVNVKKWDVKFRTFGRLGGGYTPKESQLYLAGANAEEMQENKYMRSVFLFPQSMYEGMDDNSDHLQYGGGLNVRGFVGRNMQVYDTTSGRNIFFSNGNSGLSANFELGFDRFFKPAPSKIRDVIDLKTYAFGDVAIIGDVTMQRGGVTRFSAPMYNAGLGTAITIKKFWVLNNIKPLTLRFDFPLLLSSPDARDGGQYWAPRWVMGINRAF